MKNFISNKVSSVEISGIRKFYNKVSKIQGAISLTLGQPDFPMPLGVKEGVVNALNRGETTYTPNAGLTKLREEISIYLKSQKINYDTEDICITVGGSEGLMCTFTALIEQGDSILIPNPSYPAYEACVKLLGGEVINYNSDEKFLPNIDEIESLIEEHNPKAIVLSYPSNPTGTILTEEFKKKLHSILKNREIVIITDEMYSALVYEDQYFSMAQYDDIKERIILVSGFSKTFSMTGMRVGYVCCKEPFFTSILKVHQYNVSCAPSICQYGALAGLQNSLGDIEVMKESFKERRDYLCQELSRLGFDLIKPKGAFYVFPSIKRFNMTSDEFCEELLKKAKVAVIPGTAFGNKGEGYVRISYCYSLEELKEAIGRIELFIKNL
ncbi:MAG: aminotransferase class I/II-fold pyridoxal phosphate-dependent enzyme [Clostridium sp.]